MEAWNQWRKEIHEQAHTGSEQGVQTFDEWQKENPDYWPDPSGANLTGAHFVAANLVDAVLTGANLSQADLRGANLTRARLVETNLEGANLTGCNIYGISAWR